MGSCKFKKDGWNCSLDTEGKSNYCYWHKKIDEKRPTYEQFIELLDKNLSYVYLKKADLSLFPLEGAKLVGANLCKANLCENNLQKANLTRSNLEEANLIEANLQEANVTGAKLKKADFSKAQLKGANFSKAKMHKVNLSRTNLQGAHLNSTNLQKANFFRANLQGANFELANLQGANFILANLQGANLNEANLQGANLTGANLKGANLNRANLEKAKLNKANLREANMEYTIFDSASRLYNTSMKDTNLHLSYIDHAKSFRNALLFEQEKFNEKEINEKIADSVVDDSSLYQYKFDILFDIEKIDQFIDNTCDTISKYLLDELRCEQKVKLAIWPSSGPKYIFYSDILDFIKDMDNSPNSKLVKNKLDGLLFREKMEQSFYLYLPIFKKYAGYVRVSSRNIFLYTNVNKVELYEASKEVYSKLHHFYFNEGMTFREKHAHYRQSDVDRKLLLVKNKWNSIKGIQDRIYSLFDLLVLKMLTGYGESIFTPIFVSFLGIISFWLLFMQLEGVKVTGHAANWFEYLFFSMITFTSIGIEGVQPDLSVAGMKLAIMLESTMGIAMVALIIFVITYKISR